MKVIYYTAKKIIGNTKSGKPNYYYDQDATQRSQLVAHMLTVTGFFLERTAGFAHGTDWKMFVNELSKSVKWATGMFPHNPSVMCLWAQLQQQIAKHYAGRPARISEAQVSQFNKSVKVAVALYNKHTTGVPKYSAEEFQIDMQQMTQVANGTPAFQKFFQGQQ